MEKFFKLKEHNTTVRTEIVAGLTTFFAMAYIIFVNPGMLSATGMDYTAVMMATCLSACLLYTSMPAENWCGRRDLNSYTSRYWNLNPARLPIPPRPPVESLSLIHI